MFQNRKEAGKLLSQKLKFYKNSKNAVILAIPRGGVVVGRQIADRLHIPLSVLVVKKLSAPHNPELAIGALAPAGVKYIDWDLVLRSGVEQEYFDKEIREKSKEIEERVRKFQFSSASWRIKIQNYKTFILVDDGIATGATTLAAMKYIKEVLGVRGQGSEIGKEEKLKSKTYNLKPKIILAVPVIAKDTYNKLKSNVDQIVALEASGSFNAVGQFYLEFPQVSDEEVMKCLK